MYHIIPSLFDATEVASIRGVLGQANFEDGRRTAGWAAKPVKNNLQATGENTRVEALRKMLARKIGSNGLFVMIARPKQITPLIISRYEVGMEYGRHVDAALMHGMRTDLSFTLFLSEPDDYSGGELLIEIGGKEQEIKLSAGSLVVYASTTLHRVAPVTFGFRLAAVGWVRSYIRDPAKRDMLFDLETARRALFEKYGKSTEFDQLSKTSANLLRLWAED
jgi:PKHD-type hydroxylase